MKIGEFLPPLILAMLTAIPFVLYLTDDMNTFLTYFFLPNLFISCVIAIEYIRPHINRGRIGPFIGFALLGTLLSFIAQFLLLFARWILDNRGTTLDNILYDDQEKEDANQTQKETEKAQVQTDQIRKSSRLKKNIVVLALISLFVAPLFFHFFPSKMRIVAKEYPTYRRTIVTQSDIDKLIDKGNNGDFYERVLIMQDPFFKVLVEEGFIVKKEE